MHLLVLTKYQRLGSSSRLRFLQYLPYLEAAGFEVTLCPLLDDDYVKRLYHTEPQDWLEIGRRYMKRWITCRNARSYDLVWLEGELFPWLPFWIEHVTSASIKKFIVDYDDAVFHKYDQSSASLIRWFMGKKIDHLMKQATLVIAGNKYLAQRARQAGSLRVELLPTVVDLDRYPHCTRVIHDPFTIGWIGSPNTSKYLQSIQRPLQILCNRHNSRVVLIGSGPIDLPGVNLEFREWSEENEFTLMSEFDVGIMPLPDEPWTRGKCGYKLIQYMACSLPVVATPVGVNIELVRPETGFLASSTREWVESIRTFQQNPDFSLRCGQNGRKRVKEQYSLQTAAPRLAQWFTDLALHPNKEIALETGGG